MRVTEIKDLLGNELKVGDKVAFGDTTSSNNACINTGVIEKISKKKIITEVIVKIDKIGGWRTYSKQHTFIFPRNYHNLVKIG